MNDTKHISTPKTCPLLGSHFMSVQTTVKGIHVAGMQGPIPNTVGCLEAACRFWDSVANECSEVLQTQIMAQVNDALDNLLAAIHDLVGAIQKEGR